MTVLGNREGGDEARLRWGELKLGHAADRECRAVGRARSSSAAPRPERGCSSPVIRRERRCALLRPLSTACTGENRTRVSGKCRQTIRRTSAVDYRGASRMDGWDISAGRVRSSAVYLDRFCEMVRSVRRSSRPCASAARFRVKNSSVHFKTDRPSIIFLLHFPA